MHFLSTRYKANGLMLKKSAIKIDFQVKIKIKKFENENNERQKN